MASESENSIPPELRRFITENLHSVEQLEVLLLLGRTAPRPWTAEEVSRELRSSPASAAHRLEHLRIGGLVEAVTGADGHFRFMGEVPANAQRVAELEAIYRVRPFTVMELIARSRSPFLRDFSEAFKIRRDDDA